MDTYLHIYIYKCIVKYLFTLCILLSKICKHIQIYKHSASNKKYGLVDKRNPFPRSGLCACYLHNISIL